MSTVKYLQSVLEAQTLTDDSAEMKALQQHRAEVEKVLRGAFGSVPTIRYGGSKAKGTIVRESYDLDIVCYFPSDSDAGGATLKDIFNNVVGVLGKDYHVRPKTSAVRLLAPGTDVDFHIDVVPGRFTDGTNGDCYLYWNGNEKDRLKTNLQTHIDLVRDAGVTPALRLLKLWRVRKGLRIKNFIWELLCIKLLKAVKARPLDEQIYYVLETVANSQDAIRIEDPANPQGNDLMPLLKNLWQDIRAHAAQTLRQVDEAGWEAVFGPVDTVAENDQSTRLRAAAATVSAPSKPWSS